MTQQTDTIIAIEDVHLTIDPPGHGHDRYECWLTNQDVSGYDSQEVMLSEAKTKTEARRKAGELLKALSDALPPFVLLVALLLAPCIAHAEEAPSRAFKLFLAGNLTAHVADTTTTLHALRRPGLAEGNPTMAWATDRPLALSATKAGLVAVSTWSKWEVYKRSPKAAWVWVIAETALISWVAVRNHGMARP